MDYLFADWAAIHPNPPDIEPGGRRNHRSTRAENDDGVGVWTADAHFCLST